MKTFFNILESMINKVAIFNINTTCDFIYYQEPLSDSLLKHIKE
ncbi:cyclic lactone autoinducer peptide [Thomasclavelia spiroformis]|nr:cyclic lactone autoinducer peptide [Thomasclavelia spiroformis]MBS6114282.1 cyclic lactone autoinducer peptide [Thomasclavelia spiroformis]